MLLIICECPVLRTGKFDFWLYNINAHCTGDVLQLRTQIIEHIISDEDGTTLILSYRNLMQNMYKVKKMIMLAKSTLGITIL